MFDIKKYIADFFEIDRKEWIDQWMTVFNQMAVHTRKKIPTDLLLKQRPNEEKDILDYRLCNYRAITYGSMNRALDSVSRILNKFQFEIQCDDKTKAYLETKNFTAQATSYDFKTYFSKVVLKRDIEDPNGFLIWLPTGDGISDDSVEVKPKPFLFLSDRFHDASPDVLSVLSDEKSLVDVGGGNTQKIGKIYYIITKTEFYKLIQKSASGKEEDYDLELVYKHNIGEIPALILGGDMNADGFFESYFAPYCAFGDEAVSAFSDFQAVRVTSAFPYTEEFYTEELYAPNLDSRPDKTEEKYSEEKVLKSLPRTPYGVRMRPVPVSEKGKEALGESAVLDPSIPFKRFINPDPEILKFSNEVWKTLIEYAEDALHLNLKSNFNQTEEAKKTDKEEHYAMIDKVANNYFDHLMLNSVKYVDCYLNRKTAENSAVAIVKNSSYKIKSEQDLLDELKNLIDSKAPDVLIAEVINELAKRRFSGSPLSKKIFDCISLIDPLYLKSTSEKTSLVMGNVITKEAFIRSVYAYSLLLKIIVEVTPANFLSMELKKIQEKFDTEIQPYLIDEELPEVDELGNPIKK